MVSSDIKIVFGRRIRELRKEKAVTQEAFARQVGLDRSYVGAVERGERNVSLENIALIAAGLGISLSEFFQGRQFMEVKVGRRRLQDKS